MGLFSAISDAVNSVVDAVQDVVEGVVDTVQDGANALIDGAQDMIGFLPGASFLNGVIDGVQGGLNGAVDFLQDGADFVVDSAQTFYGVGSSVVDFFADPLLPDVIEDPASNAVRAGGELLADLLEEAGGLVKLG